MHFLSFRFFHFCPTSRIMTSNLKIEFLDLNEVDFDGACCGIVAFDAYRSPAVLLERFYSFPYLGGSILNAGLVGSQILWVLSCREFRLCVCVTPTAQTPERIWMKFGRRILGTKPSTLFFFFSIRPPVA